MNEQDFRAKVNELLTFVYEEAYLAIDSKMKSGCGFKKDVENEPDDSFTVASAFMVQYLRRHADVWATSSKISQLANHYEKF